jgi:hypothetical protein
MKINDGVSPGSSSGSSPLNGSSPSNEVRSNGVGQTSETKGPAAGLRAESGKPIDRASLSALGIQISRALDHDSPELVSRIARLQQHVASGTYLVPSSEVSPRIVASLLEPAL